MQHASSIDDAPVAAGHFGEHLKGVHRPSGRLGRNRVPMATRKFQSVAVDGNSRNGLADMQSRCDEQRRENSVKVFVLQVDSSRAL